MKDKINKNKTLYWNKKIQDPKKHFIFSYEYMKNILNFESS